jgi:hypothetical protein
VAWIFEPSPIDASFTRALGLREPFFLFHQCFEIQQKLGGYANMPNYKSGKVV